MLTQIKDLIFAVPGNCSVDRVKTMPLETWIQRTFGQFGQDVKWINDEAVLARVKGTIKMEGTRALERPYRAGVPGATPPAELSPLVFLVVSAVSHNIAPLKSLSKPSMLFCPLFCPLLLVDVCLMFIAPDNDMSGHYNLPRYVNGCYHLKG